jgi:Bax protein
MSPVGTLQSRALRVRSLTSLSFAVLLLGASTTARAVWSPAEFAAQGQGAATALFSGPLPAITSNPGVKMLEERLIEQGYTLAEVRDNGAAVPRLFLARLPADLPSLESALARKETFVKMLLPLVLGENEKILRDRERLSRLRDAIEAEQPLAKVDSVWLDAMADRYALDYDADALPELVEELLERVDVIPPSLAIGQAALETGWGTSAAAQGQAMFGQMVFGEGDRAEVRRFERLAHAVEAYALNLNTHKAYQKFRDKRVEARLRGDVPSGFDLALTLARYSERKMDYVHDVRGIIKANKLQPLDRSRLDTRPLQLADGS